MVLRVFTSMVFAAALCSLAVLATQLFQRPMQGELRIGDAAPNFKLKTLDGKREFELKSNFGKRPTVLIFGSYT